ncbi:MAG: hypothetical protein UY07_C0002G0041 [Parcubacteria group bacterium GW2011_GWA1_47_8]|nr:MAG: hypothetical protein UY07_C0002G0041 [Parcubacteria group bacterium GW2011_GWA1_47_8]
MDIKKNTSVLIESLKKIKYQDLIYPGIFMFFFIIILIIFLFAVQFISKNMNKVFSSESDSPAQVLNREDYESIAKKLNIKVLDTEEQTTTASIETAVAVTTNSEVAEVATSSASQVLDKRSITIVVQNSTAKAGAATILAKALEDGGFTKPKTGNADKLYATTTIFIKESRSNYTASLLEEIKKIYPAVVATTTPESTPFDATIIIGTR